MICGRVHRGSVRMRAVRSRRAPSQGVAGCGMRSAPRQAPAHLGQEVPLELERQLRQLIHFHLSFGDGVAALSGSARAPQKRVQTREHAALHGTRLRRVDAGDGEEHAVGGHLHAARGAGKVELLCRRSGATRRESVCAGQRRACWRRHAYARARRRCAATCVCAGERVGRPGWAALGTVAQQLPQPPRSALAAASRCARDAGACR